MSEQQQEADWWQASDGRWYPPTQIPGDGWWQASDGNWYPPPQPTKPRRSKAPALVLMMLALAMLIAPPAALLIDAPSLYAYEWPDWYAPLSAFWIVVLVPVGLVLLAVALRGLDEIRSSRPPPPGVTEQRPGQAFAGQYERHVALGEPPRLLHGLRLTEQARKARDGTRPRARGRGSCRTDGPLMWDGFSS